MPPISPTAPIVIVGCGPAGLTLALELAKREIRSVILEKRSRGDIDRAVVKGSAFGISGKSYAVALRRRGLELLRRVSPSALALIQSASLQSPPTSLWMNGTQRKVQGGEENLFTTRDTVVSALLSVAESDYSEWISIRYGTRVDAVMTVGGKAVVRVEGSAEVVEAQVLVGTDGVRSVVRSYLEDKGAVVTESFEDPSPYKVVHLVQCEQLKGGMHVFVKRGKGNAIVTPFADGSLSLNLLPMPGSDPPGLDIFGATEDVCARAEKLEVEFKRCFPELYTELIQHNKDVFVRLLEASTFAGRTLKCSKYNDGPVLIIGDAAHATLPTTGQGVTAAIRGVVHLFDECGWDGSVQTAPAAFNRFSETFRDEGYALFETGKWIAKNRWSPRYVLFMMSMKWLNKLHEVLPNLFAPSLYTYFNTPGTSYAHAWQMQKRRAFILSICLYVLAIGAILSIVSQLNLRNVLLSAVLLLPGLRSPLYFMSAGKHITTLLLVGISSGDPWQQMYGMCIVAYTLRLLLFTTWRSNQASYTKTKMVNDRKLAGLGTSQRMGMLLGLAILYNCYTLPITARRVRSFGLETAGLVLMVSGGVLQAVADITKSRFKARNSTLLCKQGIYRMCRHPNYLGEIMFWCGFGLGLLPYDGCILGTLASVVIKSSIMYHAAKRLAAAQKSKYGEDGRDDDTRYLAQTPLLLPRLSFFLASK